MNNSGTILIIGATSGIAEAFCFEALKKKYNLILAGRNRVGLKALSVDLSVRADTPPCPVLEFDVSAAEKHGEFLQKVLALEPHLKGVFIAAGIMPAQEICEKDFSKAREMMETNYVSLVSLLEILARYFEGEKGGFISCLSSVAGDRGRKDNYLYGSTKAALTVYLSGLRARLHRSSVLVQTVKPGPVDTKMTKGLKKLPLLASPEKVAGHILAAIEGGQDVIYTPRVWKYIMTLIKMIPEGIFKRLGI